MVSTLEQGNRVVAENDRTHHEAERQAREAREKLQAANHQAQWDAYVDARVAQYLNSRRAEAPSDALPDALHEALGQVLAEQRREWRRERALIESEAQKTIADLRAVIAELSNEIREKVANIKPGVAGPPGQLGPPGAPGKLPLAKAWESGKVYYEGDCATHNGSTYQALRDTGNNVTHFDWVCLARAGRDGRDGATPEIRGTYFTNERYAKLDIVACDGAAFIAKHDNPGICPGDGWQMMSKQGRTGRPGQPGERGPRGEKGDQGPLAVVPQFIGARIDENYNLLRILSDGSEEVMPLRPAFERYHNEAGGE